MESFSSEAGGGFAVSGSLVVDLSEMKKRAVVPIKYLN